MKGRVAVVTGGSSGIGLAVACALARKGAHVVAVGRDTGRLAAAAAAIRSGASGTEVVTEPADVTDPDAMARMASRTLARFGSIDILVASAGIGRGPDATSPIARTVAQTPIAEWDAVIRTNLRGTYLSNRAVLPAMMARRAGQIVNVSSSRGGVRGQAFAAPYSASKFGIIGMSEALAEEVRRFNVRVQVVLPEVTDTPLLARTTIVSRFGSLLQAPRIADIIVDLIAQPEDALMIRPLIAPWASSHAGT